MRKYRIVTNEYYGFDVQERFLFFFWNNLTFTGFDNLKDAENWLLDIERTKKHKKLAKKNSGKIIKYL